MTVGARDSGGEILGSVFGGEWGSGRGDGFVYSVREGEFTD